MKSLVLDLTEVKDIDLCGIQLVVSVLRECHERNIIVELRGDISEKVLGRVCHAGLQADAGTTAKELQEKLEKNILLKSDNNG